MTRLGMALFAGLIAFASMPHDGSAEILALANYDRATETLRKTFDVLSLKRF